MSKTLLLADDSITIQKVVGITFANEDFQIVGVDNGEDAVTKAAAIKPDIILADIVMPKLDGYQVCEKIKSNPLLRHIPVLLLTGAFKAFDEERSRSVGADGHIAKPFDSQALIDKVKDLVSRPAVAPAPAAPTPPPLQAQPLPPPPSPPPAFQFSAPVKLPSETQTWPAPPSPSPASPSLPIPTASQSSDPFATPREKPMVHEYEEFSLSTSEDITQTFENPIAPSISEIPKPMELSMFDGLSQSPVALPMEPAAKEPEMFSPQAVPENIWNVPVEPVKIAAPPPPPPPPPMRPAPVMPPPTPPMAQPAKPIQPIPDPLAGFPDLQTFSSPSSPAAELSESPFAGLDFSKPFESAPAPPVFPPISSPFSPPKPVSVSPPKNPFDLPPAKAAPPVINPPREPAKAELQTTDLKSIPREIIEKIAWEIIPDLAETIIREEIERLKKEKGVFT